MSIINIVIGCAIVTPFLGILLLFVLIIRPWLRLKVSGGQGSIMSVIGMRVRGNPPLLIIDAYLAQIHSGATLSLQDVESHYIANRTRFVDPSDLIKSINKAPIHDRVAIWLDGEELQWLASACADGTRTTSTKEAACGERIQRQVQEALEMIRITKDRAEEIA